LDASSPALEAELKSPVHPNPAATACAGVLGDVSSVPKMAPSSAKMIASKNLPHPESAHAGLMCATTLTGGLPFS